jgi:hypothetical protein
MIAIALILSTCLVNDPAVCRDHKIVLSSQITPFQCMNSAMPHVAQWSEEHPQWRIVRWRCRPATEQDI